ncbi:hypothetical protein L218DRAFT_998324 [Marasmius fiardii PR-910]|nr:hypothetical protein L218DRAFT_998324 [Marasmius fiardii PR-910]
MSTHTRTRTIKPSIRLRQSTSIKPSQPSFPPPNVILHPDDANSKILNALARALLSVDNRAMTIKDLSEMVVNHGFVSQNSSAASQAISTYLRSHYARCDAQQDYPLLLRHTMSGTVTDDQLSPALYSTSGGAHIESPLNDRLTNFRRGTTVYYLSRVTGAPCPFARANIRLSDYALPSSSSAAVVEQDRPSTLAKVHCGQKRKRRSTRECVLRQNHQQPRSSSPLSSFSSDDDSNDHRDDDSQSSDTDDDQLDEQPPPKVKLTLKLPPLARVMAENRANNSKITSDSSLPEQRESCLPPYPRRSISIPPYTPSTDFPSYSCFTPILQSIPHPFHQSYRRSPSIPYSVASPPPDSEDEEDNGANHHDSDSHLPRSPSSSYSDSSDIDCDDEDDDDDPFDADFEDPEMDSGGDGFSSSDWDDEEEDDVDLENEADSFSTWDSPGPRSPSAPPLPSAAVLVKEEPTDVQGILDQWEDVLDSEPHIKVKVEPTELKWDWDVSSSPEQWNPTSSSSASASPPHIKQEEDSSFDFSLSFSAPSFTDWRNSPVVPVSPTSPISNQQSFAFSLSQPSPSDEPTLPSDPAITQSLASLIHTMSVNSPTTLSSVPTCTPCVSPDDTRIQGSHGSISLNSVHTCQPCHPEICAREVEGISVYQTSLGPYVISRRIDTDFVNLTPILNHALLPSPPVHSIPNATITSKGPSNIQGLWVPLSVAQTYNQVVGNALATFLSDNLTQLFPDAFVAYVHQLKNGGPSSWFGTGYSGRVQVKEAVDAAAVAALREARPPVSQLTTSTSPPLSPGRITEEMQMLPLSPKEEEIFQELCVNLEWEQDTPPMSATSLKTVILEDFTGLARDRSPSPLSSCPPSPEPTRKIALSPPPPSHNPNLRRSKRVANASKSRTTTGSSQKVSRKVA